MFKIVIKWTDSQNRPSKRSRVPERLVAGSLVGRLHDNCLSPRIPEQEHAQLLGKNHMSEKLAKQKEKSIRPAREQQDDLAALHDFPHDDL